MPTYEYHCQKCEATAEVLQKMSEAPIKTCPHCGQEALKRKISGGIGFSLKGSGFYTNDYVTKSPTHDGSYTHCACGKKEHCG